MCVCTGRLAAMDNQPLVDALTTTCLPVHGGEAVVVLWMARWGGAMGVGAVALYSQTLTWPWCSGDDMDGMGGG